MTLAALAVTVPPATAASDEVRVSGTVVQVHAEGSTPDAWLLDTDHGLVPVSPGSSTALRNGATAVGNLDLSDRTVEVTRQGAAAAAAADTTDAAVLSPSVHTVYVFVVGGGAQVRRSDAEVAAAFGAAGEFWRTESEGIVSGLAMPRPVDHLSVPGACGSPSLFDLVYKGADAALAVAGVDGTAPGVHVAVVVPPECMAPSGVATLGHSLASGGRLVVADAGFMPGIIAHELGHNFGLMHAGVHRVDTPDLPVADEYGNHFEVMGAGVEGARPPALGISARQRLGLVDHGEVLTHPDAACASARTYALRPRSDSAGARAVNLGPLPLYDGSTADHFVSYRSGTGVDASSWYGQNARPALVVESPTKDGGSALHPLAAWTPAISADGSAWTRHDVQVSAPTLVGGGLGEFAVFDVTRGVGSTCGSPDAPSPSALSVRGKITSKTGGRLVRRPVVGRTARLELPVRRFGDRVPRQSMSLAQVWHSGKRVVGTGERLRVTRSMAAKWLTVTTTAVVANATGGHDVVRGTTRTWVQRATRGRR